MLNATINERLAKWLAGTDLDPLPNELIDINGRPVDLTGETWRFNDPLQPLRFNWSDWGLVNPALAYALKRYVIHVLRKNSPQHARHIAEELKLAFLRLPEERWQGLQAVDGVTEFGESLYGALGEIVEAQRRTKGLYRFHRVRAWYNWCTDMLDGFGFSQEYALELNLIQVPSTEKGMAVRTEDEDGGPLWPEEVLVVQNALRDDRAAASADRQHITQRGAVALCLAYGRNPGNFVLLREADYYNMLEGIDVSPEMALRIPRIKKHGFKDREQFVTEYVDPGLAPYIQDLIDCNKAIDTEGRPRPLFMKENADGRRVGTPMDEYAFHLTARDFHQLIAGFAKRKGLVSPRTGRELHLTPRRLRYTFATAMVEQGVGRKELALMLDHTDTQHVQVYFELKGKRLVKILDAAAAKRIGVIIGAFRGRVVASEVEAINGDNPARRMRFANEEKPTEQLEIGICGQGPLCRLDPPYSCYLCPQFQPFEEADHERVLGLLLESRERRMENYGNRIGILVDDVIYAVAEVVEIIRARKEAKGAA